MEGEGAAAAAGAEAAETVHFLHIPKTAGTQIGLILERLNKAGGPIRFRKHPHRTRLLHLDADARYFFSVRDPIERFRSAFYGRKREGRPRFENVWTPYEARAFAEFEHATTLAEALFAEGESGRRAAAAIMSITHTAASQIDWIVRTGFAFELRPPVWIVRFERLAEDLETLRTRLGIPGPVVLTQNRVKRHANDYTGAPPLSDEARRNLKRWYARDYAFLAMCEAWIETERAHGASRAPGPSVPLTT